MSKFSAPRVRLATTVTKTGPLPKKRKEEEGREEGRTGREGRRKGAEGRKKETLELLKNIEN